SKLLGGIPVDHVPDTLDLDDLWVGQVNCAFILELDPRALLPEDQKGGHFDPSQKVRENLHTKDVRGSSQVERIEFPYPAILVFDRAQCLLRNESCEFRRQGRMTSTYSIEGFVN